jgi:nitroimidazol reductase NimA-like FMN-containing flavoprotein (pyridoxamine 5'-phosphate oxidase superfamily)
MIKAKSERTRARRLPARARYEREAIEAILDEALVCHLGLVDDGGFPVVIPTLQARVGEHVYVHGSAASRVVRALRSGAEVCLTATLLDGLVLARAAFHHSVNYRSVVVFGRAEWLESEEEKRRALEAFTEKLAPGRWAAVRQPTPQELRGTGVLRIPLEEASAKVRSGPPVDDEPDYALPVWAGTVDLSIVAGEPVPDPRMASGSASPPSRLPAGVRPR